MTERRFIHVTPSVSRLGGGLFESVRRLSQSVQQASSTPLEIIGLSDEKSDEDVRHWAPVPTRLHRVIGPQKFGFSPGLSVDLRRANAALVHLHGLWKYPAIAVRLWANGTGRPYVVSPHGMLEPWALRQSRWKKRLAYVLYGGPCLRGAACLRATSLLEVQSIRRAGLKNPIALIRNGVGFPSELPPPREPRPVRRALFLSRIHPKKGLLNLVRAWRQARPAGWELWVVGPDEAGHLAEVKAEVGACRLDKHVVFPGEIWGDARTQLYLESDLFVLPSFSENFGLVIAEALGCGVPVIATQATPWKELADYRCGWWIDVGVDPLARALAEATRRSSAALREMGRRGRKLIQTKYAWEPIGQLMFEVYEWMLNRCDRPACILTGQELNLPSKAREGGCQ